MQASTSQDHPFLGNIRVMSYNILAEQLVRHNVLSPTSCLQKFWLLSRSNVKAWTAAMEVLAEFGHHSAVLFTGVRACS